MLCDYCKYWQPVYAPYIKRLVPCCTKRNNEPDLKWESGGCKFWEKREEDPPKSGPIIDPKPVLK